MFAHKLLFSAAPPGSLFRPLQPAKVLRNLDIFKTRYSCTDTANMVVPSSFSAVKAHLDQIQSDPSVSIDTTLLDKLKIELTENVDPSVPATLLTQIPQILPVLQEDPTPLTVLGTRATAYFSFVDIRSINPPVNF